MIFLLVVSTWAVTLENESAGIDQFLAKTRMGSDHDVVYLTPPPPIEDLEWSKYWDEGINGAIVNYDELFPLLVTVPSDDSLEPTLLPYDPILKYG